MNNKSGARSTTPSWKRRKKSVKMIWPLIINKQQAKNIMANKNMWKNTKENTKKNKG